VVSSREGRLGSASRSFRLPPRRDRGEGEGKEKKSGLTFPPSRCKERKKGGKGFGIPIPLSRDGREGKSRLSLGSSAERKGLGRPRFSGLHAGGKEERAVELSSAATTRRTEKKGVGKKGVRGHTSPGSIHFQPERRKKKSHLLLPAAHRSERKRIPLRP